MTTRTLLSLIPALLGACTIGSPDHEVQDQGEACLYASEALDPGPQDFQAGQPVFVRVSLGRCLSACIRGQQVSCSAALRPQGEGELAPSVRIASSFAWDDEDPEEACILICNDLVATCRSQPLDAGSYWLHHGSHDRYPFAIPASTDAPACL